MFIMQTEALVKAIGIYKKWIRKAKTDGAIFSFSSLMENCPKIESNQAVNNCPVILSASRTDSSVEREGAT